MALREDGMRMINEYRCGLAVLQDGKYVPRLCPSRRGRQRDFMGRANPAMTPLFRKLRDAGFQRDNESDERDVDEDEANR
jgi:hypothetical protein